MRRGIAFEQEWLSDDVLARVRALNEIARAAGARRSRRWRSRGCSAIRA